MKTEDAYLNRVKFLIERFAKTGMIDSYADLEILLNHYTKLEALLRVQGERYHFAWRNAYDERTRLLMIKQARKEK